MSDVKKVVGCFCVILCVAVAGAQQELDQGCDKNAEGKCRTGSENNDISSKCVKYCDKVSSPEMRCCGSEGLLFLNHCEMEEFECLTGLVCEVWLWRKCGDFLKLYHSQSQKPEAKDEHADQDATTTTARSTGTEFVETTLKTNFHTSTSSPAVTVLKNDVIGGEYDSTPPTENQKEIVQSHSTVDLVVFTDGVTEASIVVDRTTGSVEKIFLSTALGITAETEAGDSDLKKEQENVEETTGETLIANADQIAITESTGTSLPDSFSKQEEPDALQHSDQDLREHTVEVAEKDKTTTFQTGNDVTTDNSLGTGTRLQSDFLSSDQLPGETNEITTVAHGSEESTGLTSSEEDSSGLNEYRLSDTDIAQRSNLKPLLGSTSQPVESSTHNLFTSARDVHTESDNSWIYEETSDKTATSDPEEIVIETGDSTESEQNSDEDTFTDRNDLEEMDQSADDNREITSLENPASSEEGSTQESIIDVEHKFREKVEESSPKKTTEGDTSYSEIANPTVSNIVKKISSQIANRDENKTNLTDTTEDLAQRIESASEQVTGAYSESPLLVTEDIRNRVLGSNDISTPAKENLESSEQVTETKSLDEISKPANENIESREQVIGTESAEENSIPANENIESSEEVTNAASESPLTVTQDTKDGVLGTNEILTPANENLESSEQVTGTERTEEFSTLANENLESSEERTDAASESPLTVTEDTEDRVLGTNEISTLANENLESSEQVTGTDIEEEISTPTNENIESSEQVTDTERTEEFSTPANENLESGEDVTDAASESPLTVTEDTDDGVLGTNEISTPANENLESSEGVTGTAIAEEISTPTNENVESSEQVTGTERTEEFSTQANENPESSEDVTHVASESPFSVTEDTVDAITGENDISTPAYENKKSSEGVSGTKSPEEISTSAKENIESNVQVAGPRGAEEIMTPNNENIESSEQVTGIEPTEEFSTLANENLESREDVTDAASESSFSVTEDTEDTITGENDISTLANENKKSSERVTGTESPEEISTPAKENIESNVQVEGPRGAEEIMTPNNKNIESSEQVTGTERTEKISTSANENIERSEQVTGTEGAKEISTSANENLEASEHVTEAASESPLSVTENMGNLVSGSNDISTPASENLKPNEQVTDAANKIPLSVTENMGDRVLDSNEISTAANENLEPSDQVTDTASESPLSVTENIGNRVLDSNDISTPANENLEPSDQITDTASESPSLVSENMGDRILDSNDISTPANENLEPRDEVTYATSESPLSVTENKGDRVLGLNDISTPAKENLVRSEQVTDAASETPLSVTENMGDRILDSNDISTPANEKLEPRDKLTDTASESPLFATENIEDRILGSNDVSTPPNENLISGVQLTNTESPSSVSSTQDMEETVFSELEISTLPSKNFESGERVTDTASASLASTQFRHMEETSTGTFSTLFNENLISSDHVTDAESTIGHGISNSKVTLQEEQFLDSSQHQTENSIKTLGDEENLSEAGKRSSPFYSKRAGEAHTESITGPTISNGVEGTGTAEQHLIGDQTTAIIFTVSKSSTDAQKLDDVQTATEVSPSLIEDSTDLSMKNNISEASTVDEILIFSGESQDTTEGRVSIESATLPKAEDTNRTSIGSAEEWTTASPSANMTEDEDTLRAENVTTQSADVIEKLGTEESSQPPPQITSSDVEISQGEITATDREENTTSTNNENFEGPTENTRVAEVSDEEPGSTDGIIPDLLNTYNTLVTEKAFSEEHRSVPLTPPPVIIRDRSFFQVASPAPTIMNDSTAAPPVGPKVCVPICPYKGDQVCSLAGDSFVTLQNLCFVDKHNCKHNNDYFPLLVGPCLPDIHVHVDSSVSCPWTFDDPLDPQKRVCADCVLAGKRTFYSQCALDTYNERTDDNCVLSPKEECKDLKPSPLSSSYCPKCSTPELRKRPLCARCSRGFLHFANMCELMMRTCVENMRCDQVWEGSCPPVNEDSSDDFAVFKK